MLKRSIAVGLIAGLAAAVLTTCGSSTTTTPASNGSLFTFVGDSPLCDVLSYRTSISGMTLTRAGGASTVNVLNPNSAEIKLDFATLRDFSTVLSLASVPPGTYDQMTVSLSFGQVVVYDPTQNPPTRTIGLTFSNAKPIVNISPSLIVEAGLPAALQIDFDLRHSVQLDANGQVTGSSTPVLTATPVVSSGNQGFGQMYDLLGFVQSVTTFSSNTNFIGGFNLQLLEGTGPALVANLTNASQMCGPAQTTDEPCSPLPLSQLLTGSFAEVDGFVGSDGNFVATFVQVEDQEVVENDMIASLGYVVSVNRDASGNLQAFDLFVREEEPDDETGITLDSTVVVNVNSSTIYGASAAAVNFAGVPFDSASINVGQELVVHGVFTAPTPSAGGVTTLPVTVAADRIYLKLQSHDGNFASLVQAGSDNQTGIFNFIPCASLFQGASVMVFTSRQTAFVNVGGLNGLTKQPSLLVQGLLFFEPRATMVNGVSVPAGTWVMLAKQVHQLI
ncbi:MAG TPA: DUF4382 domain-containing protein [Terriglobia bacterium]|nr:DUF4382 domain-containing protein [Terriglobia bacterium]